MQVRFMPPTLAVHLVGASLGSAEHSGQRTAPAVIAALGRRALTIAAAAPIGAAIFAWGAMVFGISLVHESATTAHWAVLMTALTVRTPQAGVCQQLLVRKLPAGSLMQHKTIEASIVSRFDFLCICTCRQVVPASATAAGDTVRWRRIFLLWRANGEDELSVAAPALAAMVGTWLGAWPMPLNWGTAWQAHG